MNPIESKFRDKKNSISAQTAILFPQVASLPVLYVDQGREKRRAVFWGMLSSSGMDSDSRIQYKSNPQFGHNMVF